jgi:signal transduction histidine kinase
LAVYRIVQEALTNTLKHAGPQTQARVSLSVEDQHLNICVQDTGPPTDHGQPAQPTEDGHGLVGMRERAALYGGTVLAGPRPGGGWIVQTELDLNPPSDPQEGA